MSTTTTRRIMRSQGKKELQNMYDEYYILKEQHIESRRSEAEAMAAKKAADEQIQLVKSMSESSESHTK